MDFNRNLRIVRTSGSSYPFPYKSNVLWVHHDENNNPVVEIWDHGKWVPVTGVRSGSDDVIIDTEMSDSSSNAIANKTVKKYVDGIASKTDASIISLNEGVAALQSLIDILNSDSNVDGSVKKTVADAIARVVAGAPEDLDTLKEIADYIASDKTGAAELAAAISALKTLTAGHTKSIEDLRIAKQDALVSGTNIKTINNQSILGSGNISIEGGGSTVVVDDALSDTSENPVQNKVITTKVNSLETSLGSKASQTDLDSLSSTVTTQGQTITSIQAEIGDINTQLTEING